MWIYVLQGIGYGFVAAVQPGPLQTYLISQALIKGWRKSLIGALAPLISDGPIIALSLFVLKQLSTELQNLLYIGGGIFVLYLAVGAFKTWRTVSADVPAQESHQGVWNAVWTNFLNPGPYLFWSLVTGPLLLRGWNESPANAVGLLAGFYITLISGLGAIIVLFGAARELGPKVNRALIGISALTLFCFGGYQIWLGFSNYIG